ncbi:MAG: hypothetical protein DMF56_10340 [Acidobacteria bacterium]|nr:MAG: hypothetical protein DMF56_10340 [Acidobacteriota bacterium]
MAGVNYPWIAYGHDFGKNAWGHDGLITSGWTYQTWFDSQGLVDTRVSTKKARSGAGSLEITPDLVGKHPTKSRGEVYIDLNNHRPPGTPVPIDVRHATVSCWLYLPRGSAGDARRAPNGVQFFFKSGKGFKSHYTVYQNISGDQEERWVRFTADASTGESDAEYDPTKVVAVGLKIGINSDSGATLTAPIYVDDFVIGTTPPITFDFEQLEIDRDFAILQQALGGCSTPAVRVFVFTDGRASPELTFSDQVTGLDEYFFQDFDALLESAARHKLKIIPVLLDFHWFDAAKDENGAQLGGRSNVIRNSVRRQSFLENALEPLVRRYCGNPAILAWDVINEPEWATKELPDKPTVDAVPLAEMQEFVRAVASTIHSSCPGQTVTVGSARRQWLQSWSGLGLDLYQFHWYDWMAAAEPFPWLPYAQLALDKPAVVGEVATATTGHTTQDFLMSAADSGYQGLLVWSYRAGDDRSDYANARSMLESWCGAIPRRRSVRSSND